MRDDRTFGSREPARYLRGNRYFEPARTDPRRVRHRAPRIQALPKPGRGRGPRSQPFGRDARSFGTGRRERALRGVGLREDVGELLVPWARFYQWFEKTPRALVLLRRLFDLAERDE